MNKQQFNRALLLLLKGMGWRSNNEGYAMLMTSIMAILIFSLLSVYLFSTKLYRSSAGAIVDGGSTFYAAESGMNRRASQAHGKFVGFSQPVGMPPAGNTVAEQMNNCIIGAPASKGTEDFQCVTQDFDYYEHTESATGVIDSSTKIDKKKGKSKYTAYTFIQPNPQNPIQKRIPVGENFAGLNTLEYNFRIYATSVRQNERNAANGGIAAQALLQMDFNSRVIPLFQFAAFYENELEINPSPNMQLNGPVHTNDDLYLAPGGDLDIKGQVTTVGDIYNSLKTVANHAFSTQRIILDTGGCGRVLGLSVGTCQTISTVVAWANANVMIPAIDIDNSNGLLRPRIDRLNVPQPGFLSKVDGTGVEGEYYKNADLRVEFRPNADPRQIPFQVAVVPSAPGSTPIQLSNNSLRSLRQPVHVNTNNDDEQRAFCGGVQTAPWSAIFVGLTASEITEAQIALRTAILSQPEPVPFSALNAPLTDGGTTPTNTLRTTFQNYLNLVGVAFWKRASVLNMIPKDLMALNGNCFVPAPFQVVRVNDRREGRPIQVLQANVQSLTLWNRSSQEVMFDAAGNVINHNGGRGGETPVKLFNRAPQDTSPAKDGSPSIATSLRRLGLAGSDRSEGGFVWHFHLDKALYPYAANQSTYGFGFSGGADLPNALTIATDQAIYLQGDYNNIDWKPSATMGDTIAILSNACSNADRRITCGDLKDAADGGGNFVADQNLGVSLANATETTVRSAFLSNTDLTDTATGRYSGGLNNYIRMLENWQNVRLNYNGSFISLGIPQEFSGRYQPGKVPWGNLQNINDIPNYYYYFPPIRNYSYDTNFNFAERLPPMTPKVVSLQQKVFKRDYDSNR